MVMMIRETTIPQVIPAEDEYHKNMRERLEQLEVLVAALEEWQRGTELKTEPSDFELTIKKKKRGRPPKDKENKDASTE